MDNICLIDFLKRYVVSRENKKNVQYCCEIQMNAVSCEKRKVQYSLFSVPDLLCGMTGRQLFSTLSGRAAASFYTCLLMENAGSWHSKALGFHYTCVVVGSFHICSYLSNRISISQPLSAKYFSKQYITFVWWPVTFNLLKVTFQFWYAIFFFPTCTIGRAVQDKPIEIYNCFH